MKTDRNPRHAFKFTLMILACLANTFCATIDRGKARNTVSLNAEGSRETYVYHGCEGSPNVRRTDRQLGGGISYRHEASNGANLQLDAGAVRGEILSSEGEEVFTRAYTQASVGGKIGWDWKHAGLDVGGAGVGYVTDQGELRGVTGWPVAELRLGDMGKYWWETGIGPATSGFDGRAMYMGFGYRTARLRGNLGVSLLSRPLPDLSTSTRGSSFYRTLNLDQTPIGAYVLTEWSFSEHLGLQLGLIAAEDFSGRVGLAVTF